MILQNDSLWNRLQNFSLDAPNADFPFSKKLAKEENWTLEFTKKAIEEYKKFVYLCCTLPNGASPSETVDKVWHMHLIYTQNYWEEFCPNILQRNLHHHPSKGGFVENSKHSNWFSDTLKSYREIFKQDVPEDIWKCQKKRPKEKWFWFQSLKILPILLILNSCMSFGDAFGLFIWLAPILIGVTLFAKFLEKDNTNDGDDGHSGGSSSCGGGGCGSGCGGGGCGGGCGG